VTSDNCLRVYSARLQQYTAWSRRFGGDASPRKLRDHKNCFVGLTYNPQEPHAVYLVSVAALCRVIISLDSSHHPGSDETALHSRTSKRRKRLPVLDALTTDVAGAAPAPSKSSAPCKLIYLYKPLLGAGFTAGGELAVVHTSWFKMLQHLPEPLYRKRYGT